MKPIYVILLVLCMFFMGCAITTIEIEKPNGSIVRGMALSGFGAEQSGLDVTKDGEDWLFELDSQRSEAEAMMELIKLGVEIGRAEK